jgi:hypothetical protein
MPLTEDVDERLLLRATSSGLTLRLLLLSAINAT